ncbi:helix-turn-helix domain-containing protein [Rhodococcus rhodnii]|uniref:HTH cro/C1-type domain-containing protein n=2 Tax=Rhodococcus rhodnii TaxID=38312 RepID=R7WI02_9NOCA|nr:helix-turn-helix domain-containing protein [Rhodococcus rhodnii]EOM74762.1 hypothetical protein Rrhod_3925 [Rhodococcus rhodnii LMG 5362]TXG89859.1 helix-turn-helix domain-containing protein [Rhodococcus rhodnii]
MAGALTDAPPDVSLGSAIRARRRELGRTLVQIATDTGLSHSFLSQIERGLARPSMRSLYLIASALATTQQSLLARSAGAADTAARPTAARTTGPAADQGVHAARLVDHEPGYADVTEMTVTTDTFAEFFRHSRRELVYVVAGTIEVELRMPGCAESEYHVLTARESIVCPGGIDHRHRRHGVGPAVVVLDHSGGAGDED